MAQALEANSEIPQNKAGGHRRESILDAATDLFAQHGFNDADTQALAEKLGVGKGTLYRCFSSKRELFLAATDRVMSRLHERLEASGVGVQDPIERISRVVVAYLAFFFEKPQFVEILIQERALFKDRKTPSYFEHRERRADYWRALYGALIHQGRVRNVSVDQIRDVMNQLLYGTIFTNYFTGQSQDPEQQSRAILDVFFYGILSESERREPGHRAAIETSRALDPEAA